MSASQADPGANTQAAPSENTGGQNDDLLGFDLVSLTSSAAQLRAKQNAFSQNGQPSPDALANTAAKDLTYAELHVLVKRYASAFQQFGLQPGERILITGCQSVQSIAAIIASLTAGLDAALAGLHLDSDDIAAFARHTGASAIVTEAGASENAAVAQVCSVAAQADSIRIIISLAEAAADGTVPISAAGEDHARPPRLQRSAQIITRAMDGAPVAHSQQTLIAAGLDFITQAKISGSAPVITTIIPVSFAGLVCGPIAGLLTGAPTLLHAPFDSQQLISRINQDRPVQLVVPAAISSHVASSGFCDKAHLSALVLLSRQNGSPATLTAPNIPAIQAEGVEVSDLLAYDETTAIAQRRGADGAPVLPLEKNHMLPINGREVIAVRAVKHLLENNGVRSTTIAFDGIAVSRMDWTFYDTAE